MTLFSQLTPETEKLISENVDLINEHLADWIKLEEKSEDRLFTKKVLTYLVIAKRRKGGSGKPLKWSKERQAMVSELVKLKNGLPQFQAVIDYMIEKYWGTRFQSNMITPEYMFRPVNFQTNLEQARDAYQKSNKRKTRPSNVKNQYNELKA